MKSISPTKILPIFDYIYFIDNIFIILFIIDGNRVKAKLHNQYPPQKQSLSILEGSIECIQKVFLINEINHDIRAHSHFIFEHLGGIQNAVYLPVSL